MKYNAIYLINCQEIQVNFKVDDFYSFTDPVIQPGLQISPLSFPSFPFGLINQNPSFLANVPS